MKILEIDTNHESREIKVFVKRIDSATGGYFTRRYKPKDGRLSTRMLLLLVSDKEPRWRNGTMTYHFR